MTSTLTYQQAKNIVCGLATMNSGKTMKLTYQNNILYVEIDEVIIPLFVGRKNAKLLVMEL